VFVSCAASRAKSVGADWIRRIPIIRELPSALFETTYSVGWHDMQVEFVFNEEVYEGEIDLAGRIMIGYLLCQAIWLFLHKPSRQLLLG